MSEPIWNPITEEVKNEWEVQFAPAVLLRDDVGREGVGGWGLEEENHDTGEYSYAWHKAGGKEPLGFVPTQWAECH